MSPDAENDIHSPWYEAFARHTQIDLESAPLVAGVSAEAEGAVTPEAPERDSSTEALFDCYNG